MITPWTGTATAFLALVAVMAALVVAGSCLLSQRLSWAVALWCLAIGGLATTGFFQDFSSLPPRFGVFLIPAFGFIGFLIFSRRAANWAARAPLWILLGLQTFRISVELLLSHMNAEGLIPATMTYHGRNFDILVGASAPIVAWFARSQSQPSRLIRAWNWAGIVILSNVVITGILSTPTPFRVFMDEPANTGLGSFPYTLLAAFLVPLAYSLHVLALRKKT